MPAFVYSLLIEGSTIDRAGASVVGTQAVPAVELDGLGRQLHHARLRQPREDGVERLLLADAGVESLVAAEAGRDAQRLAPQLAEAGERLEEELLVRDRVPDLERRVPGGEHREVVVIQLVDRLRVVRLELVLGDLVDPRTHD